MPRGFLIVLEGIDGAGTTTQAARLVDALRADGGDVHLTREPSDGPVGRLLREMLAGAHAPPNTSIKRNPASTRTTTQASLTGT